MKLKRIVLAVFLTVMTFSSAMPAIAAEAPAVPPRAEAGLHYFENLGVEGSKVYVHIPVELNYPAEMLTEIIYVFGDTLIDTEEKANKLLDDTGLRDIAEKNMSVVVIMNPSGAAWSQNDMYTYMDVLDLICADGPLALTFFNMQFMIGEGNGASFINRFIAQQPGRVAGVATFGGIMGEMNVGPALPAYIVGGSQAAADYYKKANETSAFENHDGKTVYYNSGNYAQRVTVSESSAKTFDKALIADAYESMFHKTTRQGLTSAVFYYYDTEEVNTLVERPDIEELGLTRVDVLETGIADQARWYEWVPNEVFSEMEQGSDKTYPLVLVLHGSGDHPLYEAETNGWVKVAGEERIIAAAPENGQGDALFGMLDVLLEKYPIDRSRIYVTGFSMGGSNTVIAVNTAPDVFAAAAPMAGGRNIELTAEQMAAVDLPMMFVIGSADRSGATFGHLVADRQTLMNGMRALNEIAPYEGEIDVEAYPFWGFPTVNQHDFVTQHGFTIRTSGLTNKDGVEMMRLAYAVGLNHVHYLEFASIAWEFFEQFSRDPETKELFLNGQSISK